MCEIKRQNTMEGTCGMSARTMLCVLICVVSLGMYAARAEAASPPATNLIGRYVAGVGITSSGGTPDKVSQWNDQSGSGYNLTQGSASAQPYKTTDLAGNPIVRFPYDYPVHPVVSLVNTTMPINNQHSSIFVIRSTFHSSLETLVSYTSWSSILGTSDNLNGAPNLRLAGRGYITLHPPLNKTLTGGVLGTANWVGYSIAASSTQASIANTDATGIVIGANPAGTGELFTGDIYEILIYNAAVSQATVDAIRAYAVAQYGIQSSFTNQVVMIGDSNTEGSGMGAASLGENYPRQAYPPTWQAFNNGIGGATLSGTWLGTATATGTDVIYDSTLTKNVALIMLGTNDINSNGRTAAATFADLDHFVGDRQTAGWEVWVMTIPPVAGTGSANELAREAYNTLLTNTANYTHVPSKIIDYRTDPRIGGTNTLAGYSKGDNLHFNIDGATVLSEYVYRVLNNNVAPVSYTATGNASGPINQNVTITFTASGGRFMGEIITPSDNGGGGTFTPTTITALSSTTVATVQYSRPTAGTSNITFTNNGILNDSSAFSYLAASTSTLLTPAFSSVSATGATASSSISSTGGANASVEGFAWGTDTSYSLGTTTTNGSFGVSSLQNATTSLTCNVTYHVRAYAINPGGTAYSSDSSFTANACTVTSNPSPVTTQTSVSSASNSSAGQQANLRIIYAYNHLTCPVNVCGSQTVVAPVPVSPISPAPSVFVRSLQVGDTGSDVTALQVYLNTHGYIVSSNGPGSPGHETSFFGLYTKNAVMRLQKVSGLPVTGFFGPLTRIQISR